MKRVLIAIIAVGVLVAWPAMASAAACCDTAAKAACSDHAGATCCADAAKKCCGAESAAHKCCDEQKKACCGEAAAAPVLLPATGHQHESNAVRPTRQRMIAKFWNPVRVGDRILMGKYVIEHDTERMARGLPCTQIYEFGKSLPVVAFHCVHLDRPYSDHASVTLQRTSDRTGVRVLTEFQLKGEVVGHGVPTVR
jgi:hypothetical protein